MDLKNKIDSFLNLEILKAQELKNESQPAAEVRIFGEVFETALNNLDNSLQTISGGPIELLINSPGGSVFDGIAMASLIKRYSGPTTATGLGFVASIASVVLLAADKVRLNKDAFLMIHNASVGFTYGEAEELRKDAELLDQISDQIAEIYTEKIQNNNKLIEGDRDKTKKRVKKLMKAETWFTAAEALNFGLIDEIAEDEEKIEPLTEVQINNLINKYGATAPKKFLNSLAIMKEETINTEATNEAADTLNFWDKLKNFFKTNPEKIEEVREAAKQETEEENKNTIEAAKNTLLNAGFVVLDQSQANEQNEALNAEQTKTAEAVEKFETLQNEYDRIMAKLREFETEFNGPSAKTELEKEPETQKQLTEKEAILNKYAKEQNIKNSRFFVSLNK